MSIIKGLKPDMLWRRFEELSAIPRNSKNEAGARKYVISIVEECGLAHKTDSAGNLAVYKPGSGCTGKDAVVLQSHLDMVCEKNADKVHDFDNDAIKLIRDGAWIRADNTTLGADNGIAVAAMIALMEEPDLIHPPLEMFLTVDEETGLEGAARMDPAMLSGKTLINLDSEEEGILYVGCAGGKDTDLTFNIKRAKPPAGYKAFSVAVKRLKGGHSGTDIHEGRGNAIKMLAGLLASSGLEFNLSSVSGGNLRNSIPREAEAVILIRSDLSEKLLSHISSMSGEYKKILGKIDQNFVITVEEADLPRAVITEKDSSRLINALNAIPSGVVEVDMPYEMVVISTNLGVCRTEGKTVSVKTLQRSIHKKAMTDLSGSVASIGKLAGADVVFGHEFAAWSPNFNSRVLGVSKECFTALFDREPSVSVIHAGLECGVIADKIPGIETISFGPTIEFAHSPSERVNIESVGRFWDFLLLVLRRLA
jgi:dipeptidase D